MILQHSTYAHVSLRTLCQLRGRRGDFQGVLVAPEHGSSSSCLPWEAPLQVSRCCREQFLAPKGWKRGYASLQRVQVLLSAATRGARLTLTLPSLAGHVVSPVYPEPLGAGRSRSPSFGTCVTCVSWGFDPSACRWKKRVKVRVDK